MKLDFKFFWLGALVLGIAGLALAHALCATAALRQAAELGVGACLIASLIGLFAKRWVLQRSPKQVLGVTGGMFFVRAALCATGAIALRAHQDRVVAYVLSFTLLFFVLVWVETAFLFAAWRGQTKGAAA